MKYTLFFLFSLSALAAESEHVLVQGSCQLRVTPDRATVTFTAENQGKVQKEVANKTHKEINELKEKIEGLKLAGTVLKTTAYSVSEVREWERDKMVDKGMRASMGLELRTSDLARVGEALKLASSIGIKNVGELQISLSEETSKATYLKCLDIAADDAKAKAQQLAKRLGFTLGNVLMVNETPSLSETPPMPERAMFKTLNAGMPNPSVEKGDQLFSTNLTVSFGIK